MEKRFIIDAHVHITSPEIIKNIKEYRMQEPYFDLLSSSPKNKFTTAEELIKHMDETGIDKSVVFGFGFKNMVHCRQANDYTMKVVKKFPERLIGFATVNPLDSGVEEELERCRNGGLRGVGELMPMGQGFDITDKQQMNSVCNFCKKNDWPLLIHLNETVGHYYPGKTKDSIKEGEILAKNFPDVTLIYAHIGGGLCFYELMPELKECLKNVYYDTAAIPFLYEKKIYDAIEVMNLQTKIILGSDFPLLSARVYMDSLEQSNLTEKDKELILSGNIKKILNIKT